MNRGRARSVRGYSSPRGRSSRSGGDSAHRHDPVRSDVSSSDAPSGSKDVLSSHGRRTSGQMSISNNSEQLDHVSIPHYPHQQDFPFPGMDDISQDIGKLGQVQNTPETVNCSSRQDEPSLLAKSGSKDRPSNKEPQCGQTSHEKTAGHGSSESSLENSECQSSKSYDICQVRTGTAVMLKAPLFVKNREKRNEVKRSLERQNIEQNIRELRSGMVLLKSYLSHSDQVKIVKNCRELGLGPGGFYQPRYRDGATLSLNMMCLGKNWDPQTSAYVDERPIDGAKPPGIPNEFDEFVRTAIQESHAILKKQLKPRNVEEILPLMSPNICIVNFYTRSGRLGLHQDKDESRESLNKGLPVVSFSIGDSAEFLYGDQRDTDSADKVILESGDVLIFGGKSRHIFHGVTAILPDTAPKALLEETKLRPGRLNLTFREY